MNSEIYQEIIMERYKNPVNVGVIAAPDVISKDYNPACGDTVEIQIKFSNDAIKEIKFQGEGCAISKASVDILIDIVKEKNISHVKDLSAEDFLKVLGVEFSPLRLKCALLGLKALKVGVYAYLGKQTSI